MGRRESFAVFMHCKMTRLGCLASPPTALMSYGVNYPALLRDTASYADRIIEGATPNELPVQLPTKFELMINLKAAKALGLSVPQSLLVAADKMVQ
jgi:putative tryptophan/tyrosine transport system substrate-binding protein